MEIIIESRNVSKSFGAARALEDISFNVEESEIFGFIGPDGAGKTTLFRIITTLLLPDSGSITVFGLDAVRSFRELRNEIGYMPGRFSLYQDLSVEENLKFYATVFGTTVEENYDLIADIYSHIEPFRKRVAGKLSGGMKQKLALSCALIHKPRLLVLDEPTTGVDAVSRVEFWEMLKKLKNYNITIIVSTPYMDEAMKCDRVALIDRGIILSVNRPEVIRSEFKGRLFTIKAMDKHKLLKALRKHPETASVFPFGDSMHVTFKNDVYNDTLVDFLKDEGIESIVIEEVLAGIEDRFLQLMDNRITV
jgi:ABC-2 type transport system ATP-binding protein